MVYLTTHSIHFIYSYMASAIFNNALNTFYLWLYGIRHMVNDHSAREETLLPPHGLLFVISSKVLLYAPFHREDSTYHDLCYTSRGALARKRKQLNGSTQWRIDPKTHHTMSEHSYHGATSRSFLTNEAHKITKEGRKCVNDALNTFYLRIPEINILADFTGLSLP